MNAVLGLKIALIPRRRRAVPALRQTARSGKQCAAIIDLAVTGEVRNIVEINVHRAIARAVRIAQIVAQRAVEHIRIVVVVVSRIAHQAIGKARIAGARATEAAQPIVVAEFVRQRDIAAPVRKILARGDREIAIAGIALVGDPGLSPREQAFEVALQHEIDDARHAVGAVDCRCAARGDVDALDQVDGNRIDVDRCGTRQAGNVATTVNQHQRPVRSQVAQVQKVGAGAAERARRPGLGAAGGRVQQRRILRQEIGYIDAPGLLERGRRERRDGRGRVHLRAGDARTGDDDIAAVGRIIGHGCDVLGGRHAWCGGRNGGLYLRGGGERDHAAQQRRSEERAAKRVHTKTLYSWAPSTRRSR